MHKSWSNSSPPLEDSRSNTATHHKDLSMTPSTRCDRTPAWAALQSHAQSTGAALDLRTLFAAEPERAQQHSIQAPHVFADLSKNRWNADTRRLLNQLAAECGVAAWRDAMFAGAVINATEGRRVGHVWLRANAAPADVPEVEQVLPTREAMLAFAEQVRSNAAIRHVVNIGIGGSDLGAQMVCAALRHLANEQRQMHFVSNIDGHEIDAVLRQCRPENTLFLIASKTFTTLETMTNARTALRWFKEQGGQDVAQHFVGLTTNQAAAKEFGIATTFGFSDWVGGRYSLWSAIGLPIAIAIGAEGFRQLLAGARDMDEHFQNAPLESNLPMQLGLLDVWNRNFLGFASRSVAPYHAQLGRFPAFLQQLEMESNGKRVDAQGEPLPYATSAVVWGEPGTNGQHAYFQMLHQGTDIVPVDFIAVAREHHAWQPHQRWLLANAIAQAQALMLGDAGVNTHRHFPGNRPSNFFVLDELNPASLGALIALHEHRVFVQGALWGINSFDQWGVELGKVLAKDIDRRWQEQDVQGLDSSTRALVQRFQP
jgi:glucose-6-phosphate isomerase